MGRRDTSTGVCDRRSDRHQSDRWRSLSGLRGPLETVYALSFGAVSDGSMLPLPLPVKPEREQGEHGEMWSEQMAGFLQEQPGV
jgi:hypothetical protein